MKTEIKIKNILQNKFNKQCDVTSNNNSITVTIGDYTGTFQADGSTNAKDCEYTRFISKLLKDNHPSNYFKY